MAHQTVLGTAQKPSLFYFLSREGRLIGRFNDLINSENTPAVRLKGSAEFMEVLAAPARQGGSWKVLKHHQVEFVQTDEIDKLDSAKNFYNS